eukprot:GHUV01030722.1.p1 GENE.GHUV01030722.1~~GHUV01030722.1.p1  ORF type:complete len:177 (+),score=32.71 GHUV01030722.1:430-960(+)
MLMCSERQQLDISCQPTAPQFSPIARLLHRAAQTTSRSTHHTNSKCMSRRYKLNIWDVGGQKTLRPYWRNYYEKTDGLIWVIDSADLARLEDTKTELHNLLHEERLFGATLLILANKQDIPAALSLQEIEQVLDLGSMAKRHCKAIACSAHTGDGLLEAFEWLVSDISSRIYLFGH